MHPIFSVSITVIMHSGRYISRVNTNHEMNFWPEILWNILHLCVPWNCKLYAVVHRQVRINIYERVHYHFVDADRF